MMWLNSRTISPICHLRFVRAPTPALYGLQWTLAFRRHGRAIPRLTPLGASAIWNSAFHRTRTGLAAIPRRAVPLERTRHLPLVLGPILHLAADLGQTSHQARVLPIARRLLRHPLHLQPQRM